MRRHGAHMLNQEITQGAGREGPGPIVDATIALGLAEDRDDAVRPDPPFPNGARQCLDIVGAPGREAVNEGAAGHGAPFSPSNTWNRPAGTEIETSSRAVKLPKCFDIPTVETAMAGLMAFSRLREKVSTRSGDG